MEVRDDSTVLASMDVVALYPSIDQKEAARIVRRTFEDSSLQVDNVDYRKASLYLALTVPQEEIESEGLTNLVPKRKVNRGRKPSIRTSIMSGPLPREDRRDKGLDVEWDREEELEVGSRQDPEPPKTAKDPAKNWTFPGEVPPESRRKLLGKVIEVAIRTTFSNHVYLYNNKLYKQTRGGSIGLRLTGVVA